MPDPSRRTFLRQAAAAGAATALTVAGTTSSRQIAGGRTLGRLPGGRPPSLRTSRWAAPKGIFPGRVVWIHNPAVVRWDGNPASGGWYEDKFTDPALAAQMLSQSLRRLTGADADAGAWAALFRHYNRTHGRGDVGYQPGERVAVKLNLNCCKRQADPAQGFFNTPQLTLALLRQLVRQAGIRETDLVVFDGSRWVSDVIFVPAHAEFPGIRFEDQEGSDGRFQIQPDKTAALHFGDPRTPDNGKTYLPACVTGATYLINAAVMKGHALAGVTLCAKNHFGSVYRENTGSKDSYHGWNPSHLHESIMVRTRAMGTYNALVDLMGHQHLGGKTMLYLIDALYASPHQNQGLQRWQSPPFNGHWTASLFAAAGPRGPRIGGRGLLRGRTGRAKLVGAVDNYLHEAAAAHQPPSGTRYDPDGDGTVLDSLGVHEHWNSPAQKQYSRNLGTGQGIELV